MEEWKINQFKKIFKFGTKVFKYDKDGDFELVDFDDDYCKMLGFEREEFFDLCRGKARNIVYPMEWTRVHEYVMEMLEKEGKYTCIYRSIHKNNGYVYVWESGALVEVADGYLVRNLTVDISKYEISKKLNQIHMSNIPGGNLKIHVSADSVYIIDMSESFLDYFNINRKEFIDNFNYLVYCEDIGKFRNYIIKAGKNKSMIDYDVRCVRKNKNNEDEIVWIHFNGDILEEVIDGIEYECVAWDINEEKKNKLKLDKQESFNANNNKKDLSKYVDSSFEELIKGSGIDFMDTICDDILLIDLTKEVVKIIDINSGEFIFNSDEMIYSDFLNDSLKRVRPKDREKYSRNMDLKNIKKNLETKHVESFFVDMKYLKDKSNYDYGYKGIYYGYLKNDNRYVLVIAQDLEELKIQEYNMIEMNNKTFYDAMDIRKQTIESQRNFMQMITKEIREPLQYIDKKLLENSSDILYYTKYRAAMDYIFESIESIYEYDRLEKGEIRFKEKPTELNSIFYRIIEKWLQNSDVKISYNINLKWQEYFCDRSYIGKILDNLLGNSILSSENKGNINLWINDYDLGNGMSMLRISIEDFGFKVNENFFGRDYPIVENEEKSFWATNNGLVSSRFSLILVRKIVYMMEGTMKMRNIDEKRNFIEINIKVPYSKNIIEKNNKDLVNDSNSPIKKEDDLSKYSIFVFEKKSMTQTGMVNNLKLNGAKVDHSASGKEGIERISSYPENTFDAIIVDEELNDMDCLSFVEMYRAKERFKKPLPIFVVMEHVREDKVNACYEIGINGIIYLPLDVRRIKKMLDILNDKNYH